jgi:ADP-ribose pyrophosphatase YjhB (NUDIX family)
MDRKFAYFAKGFPSFCMDSIPPDGFCISAFLLLWKDEPSNILMGKVNPAFEGWADIGAMNQERLNRIVGRWILPASHLLLYERPQDAASRIMKEQLGIESVSLPDPIVFSETYPIERYGWTKHWDMDFIFKERFDSDISPNDSWSELRFVDVSQVQTAEFARGHQDILLAAGVRPLP